MPAREDPVLRHARREAWMIISVWLLATLYCCGYYYLFGTIRPGRPLGRSDVRPIVGIPSWFVFGVLVPWGACTVFSVVFAGFVMKDDDLGKDEAARPKESERDRSDDA